MMWVFWWTNQNLRKKSLRDRPRETYSFISRQFRQNSAGRVRYLSSARFKCVAGSTVEPFLATPPGFPSRSLCSQWQTETQNPSYSRNIYPRTIYARGTEDGAEGHWAWISTAAKGAKGLKPRSLVRTTVQSRSTRFLEHALARPTFILVGEECWWMRLQNQIHIPRGVYIQLYGRAIESKVPYSSQLVIITYQNNGWLLAM